MSTLPHWLQRLRFVTSSGVVYATTIGFIWLMAHPVAHRTLLVARTVASPGFSMVANHVPVAISGTPVRIVLPDSGVDLTIDPGYYDPTTGDWTLSGYDAQFATISAPANNVSGQTFIYGHNNNYVFGALRHVTPSPDASALLYTSNGHIFQYAFVSVNSVAPDDTTTLDYNGPPVMTIQTCTGSLNEWRTMYHYNFVKVVQ